MASKTLNSMTVKATQENAALNGEDQKVVMWEEVLMDEMDSAIPQASALAFKTVLYSVTIEDIDNYFDFPCRDAKHAKVVFTTLKLIGKKILEV